MHLKTPQKIKFYSTARAVVPENYDRFLSKASLNNLKEVFGAEFNPDQPDLLYAVANIAVANLANKKHDLIMGNEAVAIYQNFINKPVNIEHDRERVCGSITHAALSSYPDSIIASAETLGENPMYPFNIVLGFVIWRRSNPKLADLIIEASDPLSEKYGMISTSWELEFDEYEILSGDREASRGTIVSDDVEIEAMTKHLKAYKGSGFDKNDQPLYRIVKGNLIPLGIGITTSPAGDVKGILAFDNQSAMDDETLDRFIGELQSSEQEKTVKQDIIKKELSMKIKNIKDICVENWDKIEASAVSEFIETKLSEKDLEWKAQVEAETAAKAAEITKAAEIAANLESATAELSTIKAEIAEIRANQAEQALAVKFSERMSLLEDSYELGEAERSIVAKSIRELDDEAFASWSGDFAVLAKEKSKEAIAAKAAEIIKASEDAEKLANEKIEADRIAAEKEKEVASASDDSQKSESVLDQIASKVSAISLASANSAELFEKYRNAFDKKDLSLKVIG